MRIRLMTDSFTHANRRSEFYCPDPCTRKDDLPCIPFTDVKSFNASRHDSNIV